MSSRQFQCVIRPLLTALLCLPGVLATAGAAAQQSGGEGLNRPGGAPLAVDERSTLQPLSPEEAFRLDATFEDGRMTLDWQIAAGYYLYRKSFRVSEVTAGEGSFRTLPEGETVEDPFFGEVQIYRDRVETVLNAHPNPAGRLSLVIEYQGCAESRYCYPVMTRQLDVHVR